MARPGITFENVKNAASELKGQGKNITIENVRSLLGTGSISTITKHLQKWRQMHELPAEIASKENIPEELISLLKGLWERVIDKSAEKIAIIEEDYQQETSQLKQDLEKYQNNNQRWQKLFNQWQQEKTKLLNEKLTLDQALEFAHKEITTLNTKQDGLTQQLQEKRDRIDELNRLHKQAQDNLEHYREASREQRLLDQQQFEQQKQQHHSEIKQLNEQLTIQRDKLADLQRANFTLQQANNAIENHYSQIQTELKQTKIEFVTIEKKNHEYLYTLQNYQQQNKELQNSITEQTQQLIASQTDNKLLAHDINTLKKESKSFQDQLRLITQEKWELTHEKASLEGQLKQMHKSLVI